MGFGDFLSKAAKFAGKAIVAVASEVMNQGGTTIRGPLGKRKFSYVKRFELNE